MTEPTITPELIAKHNLTPDECAHVKEILGREPSYTELGIFSVMWSEPCSYKNTRPLLKPALRVPHNDREYRQLVKLLDLLIDEVSVKENRPLASMMAAIGVLIEKYEDEHVAELA